MFVADSARVQLFSTVCIPRPAQPVLTQAALDLKTGQIRLQWNSVAGATSYRVYHSLDAATLDLADFTLVNTTTNALTTNAKVGSGIHRYVVTAWNGYEESEPSEAKTVYVSADDWTPVVVGSSAGGAAVLGVLVFWRKRKKTRV